MPVVSGELSPLNRSIRAGLADVRARIAASAPIPSAVKLVAISKTHGVDAIEAALDAGQRVFGENRVQEAQGKFVTLRDRFPDLKLHLVGPLQTNKVRDAVELFDVIQTIDRPKLAEAVAAELARTGRPLTCFIQVNTGCEPQKAGVHPLEADAFVAWCRDGLQLPITGLMCVPPVDENPALHFALLREIARRNGLQHLSMGMSGDYETAVRFGATHVRVGTAIFGSRETS